MLEEWSTTVFWSPIMIMTWNFWFTNRDQYTLPIPRSVQWEWTNRDQETSASSFHFGLNSNLFNRFWKAWSSLVAGTSLSRRGTHVQTSAQGPTPSQRRYCRRHDNVHWNYSNTGRWLGILTSGQIFLTTCVPITLNRNEPIALTVCISGLYNGTLRRAARCWHSKYTLFFMIIQRRV